MSSLRLDPSTVNPLPGILLVQIDEVLGGTTSGGIFITADMADAGGRKDTAHGIVLKKGPLPALRHVTLKEEGPGGFKRPGRTRNNTTGQPWSPEAFPVNTGDRVYFPRDIPMVFAWNETRYGLVMMDECIFATPAGADAEVKPSGS